jgi:hypothetical protein
MRPLRLFALALALLPTAAHAQLPGAVAQLFNSFNSIAFSVSGGALTADGVTGDCAFGEVCAYHLEVYLDLPAPEGLWFELALGTGVLRGFAMEEPSLDFRGSARTLPTLGAYVSTDRTPLGHLLIPYAGVRTGFTHLWNARGYDAEGVPYTVSGEAFEYGFTGGVYVEAVPLRGLYAGVSYTRRPFDALNWSLPGGGALPEGWPRALDLSAWELALGWQLRLP